MTRHLGAAGRLASAFIDSKLTPLLIIAALALGIVAVIALPARGGAADHRPDGGRDGGHARRVAGGGRAAGHAAHGEAALGGARRRVPLLDLEPGHVDGDRPLLRRPERGAGARPPQPEAGLEPRPHPRRRDAAARQGALDRRRAGAGADALGRPLRRLPAAADRRAARRRPEAGARRVARSPSSAGAPRQVTVEIDPNRLAAYGLRPAHGARRADDVERAHAGRHAGDRQPQRPARGGPLAARRPRRRQRRRERAGRAGPCCVRDVAAVRDGDAEATSLVTFMGRDGRSLPGGHDRRREAQGHERHRPDAPHRREDRDAARHGAPVRPPRDGHPRLRRDGRAQVERAALPHAPRRALRRRPDLAGARPARVAGGARGHSGDARAHALRLLSLRLHAQPHHAVRADLLDRHPGRRRDRRRREHRAARADDERRAAAVRGDRRAGGRRGRQPDHPGHPDRDRRDPADGLRRRPDGPLHAADPGRRLGGDDLLAARRLHRDAVGVDAAAGQGREPRTTSRRTG